MARERKPELCRALAPVGAFALALLAWRRAGRVEATVARIAWRVDHRALAQRIRADLLRDAAKTRTSLWGASA